MMMSVLWFVKIVRFSKEDGETSSNEESWYDQGPLVIRYKTGTVSSTKVLKIFVP